MDDMENAIRSNPALHVLDIKTQADHIWVPMSPEGWEDYSRAIKSHLSLLKRRYKKVSDNEIRAFIDGPVKTSWFEYHDSYTEGYITDYVFQKYVICEVNKKQPLAADSTLTERL
jgi:hypothetical protein